jgi:hypothetical protein
MPFSPWQHNPHAIPDFNGGLSVPMQVELGPKRSVTSIREIRAAVNTNSYGTALAAGINMHVQTQTQAYPGCSKAKS